MNVPLVQDHHLNTAEHASIQESKASIMCKGAFAGAIGGINITLIGHPFDTLKVRLQTQPQHPPLYTGLLDCLKKTVKWEGMRGLYTGMTSPLIGQMLFRAALFLSHSETKQIMSENNTKELGSHHYFIAGAIGWGVGSIIECPFDVIKSQLQVQIIESKTHENAKPKFTSMHDCGIQIWKTNGIRGLYHGYFSHLLRNLPAGALHLGIYDVLRHKWADKEGITVNQLRMYQDMTCGSVAGVIFWTAVYPLDVIKSTLQADSVDKQFRKYSSTWDCTKKLYADGGVRSFYRGLTPCVLRAIPANAAMLYTVTFLQRYLSRS